MERKVGGPTTTIDIRLSHVINKHIPIISTTLTEQSCVPWFNHEILAPWPISIMICINIDVRKKNTGKKMYTKIIQIWIYGTCLIKGTDRRCMTWPLIGDFFSFLIFTTEHCLLMKEYIVLRVMADHLNIYLV